MMALDVTLFKVMPTGLPLQMFAVALAMLITGLGSTVTVVLWLVGFVQPVALTWNVYVTTIGAVVPFTNVSTIF